jgi:signal transduction histidine kinase
VAGFDFMQINLRHILWKSLELLRLRPLSLAEKCRVTFGAAVLFILALALLLPYIWMGQLTKKASLDAGRAKAETLLRRHFQLKQTGETALATLDNTGAVMDANAQEIRWIRFAKEEKPLEQLTGKQKEMIESLKADGTRDDVIQLAKKGGILHSSYVRIFRATDSCISCHNPQGSAGPFSQNRTVILNRVWIIVAGLIAGAGAIVAFYMITQRVILRPIRQLRAIANNVAEGNLDIRSSIKTRDEYEKLASAFNHMLDGLQAAQEKLRQANKQLDDKIAELSERNIELFKANKIKSEFLANISHEFRTPLNAILGFAEILREKPGSLANEKGRRYAENIITGGKNLLNMINDLLDLAKTEAGKMKLHIEETSIPQLCKALVGSFSALTKKKKIKVKLLADDIPPLMTDAGKVQQILYNFLSNAVKFTPKNGRIEIRAAMADEKMARIAVSDTGPGIAAPDREKIFEKFRQADGSITRQSTGSGLGLAISKELAAMLAGSIATFWLDIPVTITQNGEQAV